MGTFFMWVILVWAIIQVFNVAIEAIIDGITPDDIMWWLCRPISFYKIGWKWPMLIGILGWIAGIVGTYWAVAGLFF